MLLNNADWLLELRYIEFLRDIGRHFSVNRMLAAESYKLRFEAGLNFVEFNYQLLQAFDFLYLSEHYDCILQMGAMISGEYRCGDRSHSPQGRQE